MWVGCLREGSPLALLTGNLYLLADRKARRWGRSGMQRLEDSRDIPGGGGARRDELGNLRGDSLLFPGTLSSPVLNLLRTFRTGKFPPFGVPIFFCVFMLASYLFCQIFIH